MKKHVIKGPKIAICRRCRGTGKVDGETCPYCEGSGRVIVMEQLDVEVTPWREEN